MKEQENAAYCLPDTKEEIYALFSWYDFRDELGQSITTNIDFEILVEGYLNGPREAFIGAPAMSRKEARQRLAIIRAWLARRKLQSLSFDNKNWPYSLGRKLTKARRRVKTYSKYRRPRLPARHQGCDY